MLLSIQFICFIFLEKPLLGLFKENVLKVEKKVLLYVLKKYCIKIICIKKVLLLLYICILVMRYICFDNQAITSLSLSCLKTRP